MNMRGLRNIEVRFGVAHITALIGLVTGSLACAFYLGFYSGQDAGFDKALASSAVTSPRLAIAETELSPEIADAIDSEIFARLGQGPDVSAEGASAPLPTLESIRTSDEAPIQVRAEALEEAERIEQQQLAAARSAASGAESRLARGDSKTLGMLIAEQGAPQREPAVAAPIEQVREAPQEVKTASLKPETVPAAQRRAAEPAPREQVKAPEAKPVDKPAIAKVETKREPVTPKGSSFIRKTLPKGWFAQVAAPQAIADADRLAQALKGAGFPVVIEQANVRGQEYFRVLVGPEENRQHAERLVGQLKRESVVKNDPFLRVIK